MWLAVSEHSEYVAAEIKIVPSYEEAENALDTTLVAEESPPYENYNQQVTAELQFLRAIPLQLQTDRPETQNNPHNNLPMQLSNSNYQRAGSRKQKLGCQ
jgi:hypothetical protein